MTKLTAKQEGTVVDCIVNGMTQSDAYRNNYSAGKMTSKTVNETASKLFADPKIAARVAELQEKAQKRLDVTVDSQIAGYRELMQEARLLLSEEGATTSQSIDLRIKTMARIDKICGLEQNKHDITSGGESIRNEWHIHPVTTKKNG